MAHLSKAQLKRKLRDKAGLTPERHLLLCTGSNCQPELAAKTWRCLGQKFKELEQQGQCFHRTQVQCFSLCRSGPIALVYPEGTYYHDVSPKCASASWTNTCSKEQSLRSSHSPKFP